MLAEEYAADFVCHLGALVRQDMRIDVGMHPIHRTSTDSHNLSERSCSNSAYRWLERDYRPLFPHLVERTWLFRLVATHQGWTMRFLAESTLLGAADSYGVELLRLYCAQRCPRLGRLGRKGFSNHRWIVGGKVGVVLNNWGALCAWDAATANVHDGTFQPLIARFADAMVVLADEHVARREGNPPNLKVRPRGRWNDRMLVETTFSMLTLVCHAKHALHHVWPSPWPSSICWSNGTASPSMTTARSIVRLRSSACGVYNRRTSSARGAIVDVSR